MFFNHHRAERRRRQRNRNARRVIRIADGQIERAPHRRHRRQIYLVERRRIFRRAVQQRHSITQNIFPLSLRIRLDQISLRGRSAFAQISERQHSQRRLDFAECAHARRQNYFPPRPRDLQ